MSYRVMCFILCGLLLTISCKQLIKVDSPADEIPAEAIYTDDRLADAAVADLYYQLSDYFPGNILPVLNGMTADELTTLNSSQLKFVNNAIPSEDVQVLSCWRKLYQVIYGANAMLEGITQYNGLSPAKARQLAGEAMFLRAFSYYYLVNCWGEVPLITVTDINQTALAPNARIIAIYQQITRDLSDASLLLSASYVTGEKVRANKWSVLSMLARVYLHQGRWAEAAAAASQVINAGDYTPLISLDSVFLRNSRPAILQLWRPEGYTFIGQFFLPAAATSNFSFYPFTNDFMQEFEPSDKRKSSWTNSFVFAGSLYYNACKYRNRSAAAPGREEYLMMLRIEEQYLIRAEAAAMLNQTSTAIADLNVLRVRAGLPPLSADTMRDSCLVYVEKERRRELFTEWGDRWISLSRTQRLDSVMKALKPGWKKTAALYPIPQEELNRNPNLKQNEGYQ
ncbi:RagB/SusD family nutrient uptake outer membrane protein [Chitinophaga rhizophila]|uniref:RagB/SusD family nutrient uptake outer membrane protein n=1 Tax=Chitinophaga rhizophila TaxID=2866212 RepID=A0ABS7GJU8_9BACT|nr:RagB/SusD family nutrient uptake outer membrane protein [Chitinophaga rhizophila]MBW8687556.1 RagB/SusD family nutrient uptake outer membrane protein [Chitinophaga rhizophila]